MSSFETVSVTEYPTGLGPDHRVDLKGSDYPATSLVFGPWTGEPMLDTWGGKGAITSPVTGEAVFAELAIQHLASNSTGWDARWAEAYGAPKLRPHMLRTWPGHHALTGAYDAIPDPEVNRLLDRIAAENEDSHAGIWDVIAWRPADHRVVFFESKRLKHDRIRDSQIRWAQAAERAGVPHDALVLVEWVFAPAL